jgi:hypothetical protein
METERTDTMGILTVGLDTVTLTVVEEEEATRITLCKQLTFIFLEISYNLLESL